MRAAPIHPWTRLRSTITVINKCDASQQTFFMRLAALRSSKTECSTFCSAAGVHSEHPILSRKKRKQRISSNVRSSVCLKAIWWFGILFFSPLFVFLCVFFFVFIALNLFACCCSSTTGKKSAQNGKLKEMNRGRIELEHRSLLFLLPFYRIYFLVFFLHERNGSNGNSPEQLR